MGAQGSTCSNCCKQPESEESQADCQSKIEHIKPQLVAQLSCFCEEKDSAASKNEKDQPAPVRMVADSHQVIMKGHNMRFSDAVSPVHILRLPEGLNLRKGGSASSAADPVVQNLCEAFGRATSTAQTSSDEDSSVADAAAVGTEEKTDDRESRSQHRTASRIPESRVIRTSTLTKARRRNILSAGNDSVVVRNDSGIPRACCGSTTETLNSDSDVPIYKGELDRDGHRHGFGVLSWKDGRRYEGQFRSGVLQGDASMSWPDGRMYTGQYRNNKKHGNGILWWPDGRKYCGEWQRGMRHGHGVYTSSKGQARSGIFYEDKPLQWDVSHDGKPIAPVAGNQVARAGGA
eukprot:TRINITY_DN32694_c0_g1_i1.p1 TRINITY_DN32694_c0_g1~~TRINITY_DN32694_c0_g1_i1.p1  ORF type:complete len:347 (-),score=55.19 TRINITY_DN32694_c0_g1_i1:179-1219(-)